MWYLFVITRRASLLNDFVGSLNRLGLLQPLEYEDGDGPARQRRVFAYLQKFEASYGPLSRTLRGSAYVAVIGAGVAVVGVELLNPAAPPGGGRHRECAPHGHHRHRRAVPTTRIPPTA